MNLGTKLQKTPADRVHTMMMAYRTPAEAIEIYAQNHGVDLVVMSTHGRGGLSRMVFGSERRLVAQLARFDITAGVFRANPLHAAAGQYALVRHVEQAVLEARAVPILPYYIYRQTKGGRSRQA